MLHYYIAYGLMLFIAILCIGKENKNRIYCVAFAGIWIVILGFRNPMMGVDIAATNGYLDMYSEIGELSWGFLWRSDILNYEKGYVFLNKLLNYISNDPQVLMFVCALIIFGVITWWIYRNSEYPFLSSIIYLGLTCFMINFSGLRQGLAIVITLCAFEMIKKKKIIWFVLLVLLASTFHSSAGIFLIAYPVYYMRLNKVASIASMFIPITVWFLRYPLFAIFSRLFKENAQVDDNGAIILFLVFWLVYAFSVLFGHEGKKEELGARNLFLFACICQAFGGVHQLAMRVAYYFMIYLAILLPSIIKNTLKTEQDIAERGSGMIMYLAIVICFAAFGLDSLENSTWAMANPHYFFWQEVPIWEIQL